MNSIYQLNGHSPRLPEKDNFWIASDAVIVGNVFIGDLVSVWFGAKIRGDNEEITIKSGTNIQENSVLHTDMGYPICVGANCTIGHRSILHGCKIQENTLIGMGAIILNGVKIGRNCLIGAGSLITEGKEIPEGSLVLGSPGKVVRNLKKSEIDDLKKSALIYQSKIKSFRDNLHKI